MDFAKLKYASGWLLLLASVVVFADVISLIQSAIYQERLVPAEWRSLGTGRKLFFLIITILVWVTCSKVMK